MNCGCKDVRVDCGYKGVLGWTVDVSGVLGWTVDVRVC